MEDNLHVTQIFSPIFICYSQLYLRMVKFKVKKAWKESGTRSQHFKSNLINIFAVVKLSKILSYYQKDNGNSWFTEFWLSLSLCSLSLKYFTQREEKKSKVFLLVFWSLDQIFTSALSISFSGCGYKFGLSNFVVFLALLLFFTHNPLDLKIWFSSH